MSDHPPAPEDDVARGGLSGHVRSHARGLSEVVLASILGVLASFVFQIASARYLAPAEFGLLSAFLAVVSTAAIGSSSLQNIVTVQTADALAHPERPVARRRIPVDALVIGAVGGALVAAASPFLGAALDSSASVVLAAALCIPLSFVFADALGLLQGSGQVSRAVWWSTVSLVLRVGLLVIAIIAAWGIAGVIGAVVVATAATLVGAVWSARRVPRPAGGAFTRDGAAIVVLTVAFAWLTSSDVLFLRAGEASALAGSYAAATVLVKAGFLVPSTLSLYLLPRFVRNRGNRHLSRMGVLVTLGLSLATSLAMITVFALLGPWLIHLLYGEEFAMTAELLVPVCLAYLPWMAAQGMLIKMTSFASRAGAAVLAVAVAVQFFAFQTVTPDVTAMLVWFGAIGVVVVASFLVIDSRHARRTDPAERTDA
ncbi:lipopolysaccharide biosynthesis protein [Microbacterium sp. 2C]|uniref:oligosaccharide flippase family protein n=1 Tax=Microbacterium paulum TaxID=2707006 RepID=UPI0018C1EB2C|nr:lipopolysaccharide biosynthesis protein [Microbacterium paulum]MBG0717946.1 lipopolysaccharide biosynthesis protein [Microbacterium paulum]